MAARELPPHSQVMCPDGVDDEQDVFIMPPLTEADVAMLHVHDRITMPPPAVPAKKRKRKSQERKSQEAPPSPDSSSSGMSPVTTPHVYCNLDGTPWVNPHETDKTDNTDKTNKTDKTDKIDNSVPPMIMY